MSDLTGHDDPAFGLTRSSNSDHLCDTHANLLADRRRGWCILETTIEVSECRRIVTSNSDPVEPSKRECPRKDQNYVFQLSTDPSRCFVIFKSDERHFVLKSRCRGADRDIWGLGFVCPFP